MSSINNKDSNINKILNTDIYQLTNFVRDVKNQNIEGVDDKEALVVGIYGYIDYQMVSLLQNSIMTASELANEAIPTRAKFDRNVITHALSLGLKINAIPATMKVILMIPERALLNNMINDKFIFTSKTPISIGGFEYHVPYDITVYKNNLADTMHGINKYVYTAQYDLTYKNPISDIKNNYLPPVSIYNDVDDNMVMIITTLHQVEHYSIEEKIIGNDNLTNRTLSFSFDKQLSHFKVTVIESSGSTIELTPVYDGLSTDGITDYCYYQYVNNNSIRIKFDPNNSYQPRNNCDVIIDMWITEGSSANFKYSDDVTIRLTSDVYSNLYMIVKQRSEEGSTGGKNRRTIPQIQAAIPKEALSRGTLSTATDLRNYFNSINNDDSIIHIFNKEDNNNSRVYYTYCLMKDNSRNIIPTNTISLITKDINTIEDNQYIESGSPIYLYKNDLSSLEYLKKNFAGYLNENPSDNDNIYKYDSSDVLDLNDGDNIKFKIHNTDNWKLGTVLSVVTKNARVLQVTLLELDQSANNFVRNIYKIPIAGIDILDSVCIVEIYKVTNFIYTSPFSIILNNSAEANSPAINTKYYLEYINENRFLDFKCINSKSPMQFIASYVNVFRPSFTSSDRYKYTITVKVTPTQGTASSDIVYRTQLIGVYYKDGTPYYSIGEYIASESDTDIMTYKFYLYTKRFQNIDENEPMVINIDNELYIGDYINDQSARTDYSLFEASTNNTISPVYFDANTNFRIYTMFKYNNIEGDTVYDDNTKNYYSIRNSSYGTPLADIVPGDRAFPANPDDSESLGYNFSQMVLTNVYEVTDGIQLIYDYTNVINSSVTTLQVPELDDELEEINTRYNLINKIPVIRYFYLNSDEKIYKFISELKYKIDYVKNAIIPLETTFGLDFKFFNTYGPSNMYYKTNIDGNADEAIDNVGLTLTFRIKFYNEADKDSVIPLIKDDIKTSIEKMDKLDDIHFPNIVSEIKTKYSDYLVFFEFLEFNSYNTNNQHIITNENMDMLTKVPEFLNIDTDDYSGTPRINIKVII